jgi:hypothetical protein
MRGSYEATLKAIHIALFSVAKWMRLRKKPRSCHSGEGRILNRQNP